MPATPIGGGRLGECGLIVPAGAPPLPSDISAGAWLIADLDTGEVLAAKDPHGRYRPASTLKLLTVQPLLKNLTNLDQIVEGTENDADQDGTRVGIEAGGKYTVRQLLTYLIIISGNDAANALARTNGGYDKTVADMNATANALGALDTRAATVVRAGRARPVDVGLRPRAVRQGRHGDAAVPGDRLQRRRAGARPPTARATSPPTTTSCSYQYPGALGGKTGFTDDAGNTYVGMAAQNGRRLVVTMMNGTQQPQAAVDAGRVTAGLGLRAAGDDAAGRQAGRLAGRGDRRRRAADREHRRTGQHLGVRRRSAAGAADGPAEPTSGAAAEPASSHQRHPDGTDLWPGSAC